MANVTIDNPQRLPALLSLGFRPFFLGGGFSALLSMAAWTGMLRGWLPVPSYYEGTPWHAHEMLFGYVAAVIAGFLLTAVRNWTGMATPTGRRLGVLAGLWLAARIAPLLSAPGMLIAVLDVAFFPALAVALFRPLWWGPNRVNRVFLFLLAGMALASLLVHLQELGLTQTTAARGTRLMLDLTLFTVLLVAGRVMPFFTERGVPGSTPRSRPMVERLTFALAAVGLLINLAMPWSTPAGLTALVLAAVQAMRLAGWHDRRVWGTPILAVLYAGYLWLVAGLALDGLAGLGLVAPFPALHALTAGAIGVFTLGMMARVALGHTGREMRSSRPTNVAFVLVNLAALVRVGATLLLPGAYASWILLSGLLWALAFALFLLVYAPILVSPRADGRPG
jgi:uncharacterized protein involved in response to NO